MLNVFTFFDLAAKELLKAKKFIALGDIFVRDMNIS